MEKVLNWIFWLSAICLVSGIIMLIPTQFKDLGETYTTSWDANWGRMCKYWELHTFTLISLILMYVSKIIILIKFSSR